MRFRASLVLFATLVPALSGAQTTSDGVQALVRGDYVTAVRILKPLAEGSVTPDPLAQFFIAMLYESGRGVGLDTLHACVLFAEAARNPANPLSHQALALAGAIIPSPDLLRR